MGTDIDKFQWTNGTKEQELAALLQHCHDAYAQMKTGRVAPAKSSAPIQQAIDAIDFEKTLPMTQALDEVARLMEAGDLRAASARCFGYFNPTAAWPAVLGDLLASVRNPQICVSSHAPASVAMERKITDMICAKLSMPNGTAHFTSGGSEANETALLTALCRVSDTFCTDGVRALSGAPTLYACADSHLAWIKIAKATGLGAAAVRLVATDGAGRMDVAALEKHIAQDKQAGHVPVMIAATCGTTSAGMIDPLYDCHAIAEQENLHFHIDAAWAGALIFDAHRSHLLAGIEMADSVTIDAHKWLSVPMGAGLIALRDPSYASNVFSVKTCYMPEGDGQDFYITTNQWSRRFLGIRLWMMVRVVGETGYGEMFDRHFALAAYARKKLAQTQWTIRNDSPLPVLVFTDAQYNLDAQAIADALQRRGKVWLGRVDFEGQSTLRLCTTSFLSSQTDVDLLLRELDVVRGALAGSA